MRLLLLTIVVLCVSACGYRLDGTFPAEHRTVSVDVFENRTFVPELGADVAEAVAREIQTRTPYRIAGVERSDTVLTGVVRRVEQDLLSRTPTTSLPQEVEVRVRIDFTWTDARTGAVLASAEGLEQVGRFVPPGTVGERVEVGDRQAIDRLAADVVSLMRTGL